MFFSVEYRSRSVRSQLVGVPQLRAELKAFRQPLDVVLLVLQHTKPKIHVDLRWYGPSTRRSRLFSRPLKSVINIHLSIHTTRRRTHNKLFVKLNVFVVYHLPTYWVDINALTLSKTYLQEERLHFPTKPSSFLVVA